MNKADNDATTRVVDSLINYEVSISVTNAFVLIYLCCLMFSLFCCLCHNLKKLKGMILETIH